MKRCIECKKKAVRNGYCLEHWCMTLPSGKGIYGWTDKEKRDIIREEKRKKRGRKR